MRQAGRFQAAIGRLRGRTAGILAALAAALATALATALALGGAAAGSEGPLPLLGSVGSYGAGAGQMENPRGIAVHQGASGPIIYIADQLNERIDALDAAGKFVLTFGAKVNATKVKEAEAGKAVSPEEENVCTAASGDLCKAAESGAAGGQMKAPVGVAADPSSGDVYVESFSNHRIEKYTPEGKFLLAFGGKVNKKKSEEAKPAAEEDLCAAGEECQAGVTAAAGSAGEGTFHPWAIGPLLAVGSKGTVYVGDEDEVQKFSSEGHYLGRVELAGAGKVSALAVGPEGNLFVKSTSKAGVREYSASGSEVRALDGESTAVRGIAVSAGGDVYIVDQSPSAHVLVYGPSGELLKEGGAGRIEDEAQGIAVAGTGKAPATTVYVTSMILDSAAHLSLLGEAPSEGLPAPEVAAQAVVADEPQSATLAAQINPYFGTASWYVQYGRTTAYEGGSVPAPPGSALGPPIFGNEEARLTITGLAPGTLYHYRFVAVDSAGTTYGPDATLQTLALGQLGLPDGRVYEQVSPVDKGGTNAGISGRAEEGHITEKPEDIYAQASPEGEGLLYLGNGTFPGVEAHSGAEEYYVANRTASGWVSRGALPAGYGAASESFAAERPLFLVPARNLRSMLFSALGSFVAADPVTGDGSESEGIYLSGEDTAVEPQWLSAPQIASPFPAPGALSHSGMYPAGASPNLKRIYFAYPGTLLPEDVARAANIVPGPGHAEIASGFYEWSEGTLRSAALKPSGIAEGPYDPFGAVPAAVSSQGSASPYEVTPDGYFNEVSEDGSKAFFLSPEPEYCVGAGRRKTAHCEIEASIQAYEACKAKGCSLSETPAFKDPVELYVRENGVPKLISADELAGGAPAPAYVEKARDLVTGVSEFDDSVTSGGGGVRPYIYASPDGSRVFFASRDRLTAEAPEPAADEQDALGTASEAAPKLYEYDLETSTLRYLASSERFESSFAPMGQILASSRNGSSFVQVRYSAQTEKPGGLLLWREGKAQPIAEWTPPAIEGQGTEVRVAPLSMTANGETVVFESNAVLWPAGGSPGAFNNSPAHDQVYRYEVASGRLSCLSCAPQGITPSGDAHLSSDDDPAFQGFAVARLTGSVGVSANGRRVFFDSPERLVAQATNGQRDVYEWEAGGEGGCAQAEGCIYLISPGTANGPSFYLASDESGANVFFTTTAAILPADTDGSYNVFDARIDGGFPATATPVGCGESCQSPPPALGAPAPLLSAAAGPSGNIKAAAPKKAKKKGAKGRGTSAAKRRLKRCLARARRIKSAAKRHTAMAGCRARARKGRATRVRARRRRAGRRASRRRREEGSRR